MLMTPGPTEVPESVLAAMSRPIHNPDIEPEFAEFYRSLTDDLARVYDTDDDVLILGGEGMLGLDASLASLLDGGEKVLCLSNGLFGEWFADFVELHGGEPLRCESAYTEALDVERAAELLDEHDVEVATMVHCETPTGTLNDLDEILSLCAEEGVLTVVDAVSSLGGTSVPVADVDICIGASQKCFSTPPGLTTLSVSDAAWDAIERTEQSSFYASLAPWKEQWLDDGVFPYTHLVSNLYALDEALTMLFEEGLDEVYDRHEAAAGLCRDLGADAGLSPYPPDDLCSPTVTAFEAENARTLQRELREKHDITVATSLADLEDEIVRIGHMGTNADRERVEQTMTALRDVLA